jgi:hypothetical protein
VRKRRLKLKLERRIQPERWLGYERDGERD